MGLGAIDYGFDAEVVNFERNVGVTGWRMDVAPRVGFDWSAPGFFVRPSAGYRYTQYSLKDAVPGTDESPTRSLPLASLDAGLVFERTAGSHGQRRMTLEPRALYLYAPFREQSNLPLFDTGPARSEPGAAVPRQSLRGRRSRQRRQPDRLRPHQPSVRRRQRRAVPRGERRPGLLLRKAARGVAGRARGHARHLGLHRAGLVVRVQELERRSRPAMESRRHPQRAFAVPPAISPDGDHGS